jgi:hypothetical protein
LQTQPLQSQIAAPIDATESDPERPTEQLACLHQLIRNWATVILKEGALHLGPLARRLAVGQMETVEGRPGMASSPEPPSRAVGVSDGPGGIVPSLAVVVNLLSIHRDVGGSDNAETYSPPVLDGHHLDADGVADHDFFAHFSR